MPERRREIVQMEERLRENKERRNGKKRVMKGEGRSVRRAKREDEKEEEELEVGKNKR